MSLSVARRNLFRQKTRLAISAGGVSFAITLMLLVFGLYSAWSTQAAEYIRSVLSDIWVAQGGTPGDFFHSVSLMPVTTKDALGRVSGVREVQPFIGRQVLFRRNGIDSHFFLVGVDQSRPLAAPPNVEGKRVPGPGELVVDKVFARMRGVKLGESLTVKGERLQVVGLSSGTNAVVSQYAFTDMATAVRVLQADIAQYAPDLAQFADSITNYMLVRTDGRAESVVGAIRRQVPGLKPMTSEAFVEANLADLKEGFLPILFVLVLISFAIGTAIIGLTIYTATIEKAREYGVLKAIGFTNRRLFRVVAEQSLVTTVIGFAGGIVLVVIVSRLLGLALPLYAARLTVPTLAGVFAASLAMGAVSALVPARPIAAIDPAEVFRA